MTVISLMDALRLSMEKEIEEGKVMKVLIILRGPGGELDRQTAYVGTEQPDTSNDILEALKTWSLAPGDTIVIEEDES